MRIFKFIIIKFVFLSTLFFKLFDGSTITVMNNSFSKTSNISIEPVSFNTRYVYTDDLFYGEERVKRNGEVGYKLVDSKAIVVRPKSQVIEVGTGALSVSYGSTTGYGADCVGCSGNVSCIHHNLSRDGIYYNDSKYGSVRIIAADNGIFSCGSIIEVDNGIMPAFKAIVLDTGGAMRSAARNGNILVDIAFPSESSSGINNATNRSGSVKFKVYRYGWQVKFA